MVPTGLINVTVHSTDVMILCVLSQVLKFVIRSGISAPCFCRSVLSFAWFQNQLLHLAVLFLASWVRQTYGFAFFSVSLAAEVMAFPQP